MSGESPVPMSWVELWDRAALRQKCDAKQGDMADVFSAPDARQCGTELL
jgi:hypothetical protein